MKNFKKYVLLLLLFLACEVNAQTKTLSRLIAKSYYRDNLGVLKLDDTMVYDYGIGRGGDLNSDEIDFDRYLFLGFYGPSSSLQPREQRLKTYNAANKLISETFQSYNIPSSSWFDNWRKLYSYDANRNVTSIENQTWGGLGLSKSLTNHSYNASNLLIGTTNLELNSAGSWIPKTKDTSIFDTKGNQTLYQTWNWDTLGNKWDNVSRLTNIFDSNNDKIKTLSEKWESSTNSWVLYGITESTYDAMHNPLLNQNYYLNFGVWTPWFYEENTYNSSGNWLSTYRKEKWIPPSSSSKPWDTYYKFFIEYDGLQRMTMYKNMFSSNGIDWEKYDSLQTVYDPLNEYSETIKYKWDSTSGKFKEFLKENKTYNKYLQDKTLTFTYWDAAGFWQSPRTHINYYYEEFTAGIKELGTQNGAINVYPIPASQYLNLEINWPEKQNFSVSIYDVSGRNISNWKLKNEKHYLEHFPLDNFSNGQFFMVVISEKGDKISKSFIVKK